MNESTSNCEQQKIKDELSEMYEVCEKIPYLNSKLSTKCLDVLLYVKVALFFEKTDELNMIYSDIQKTFKQFYMQSSEVLLAENVDFLYSDDKDNQLYKMNLNLKCGNLLEFIPNENLDQIVKKIRTQKEDERIYLEVSSFHSISLLKFMFKLKTLEKALDIGYISLNEHQVKHEKYKLEFSTLKVQNNLLTLETSLKNVLEKKSEIYNKFGLLFLLGMQETPELKENEHITCAVCLGDVHKDDMLIKLKCGHCFRKKCIKKWFEQNISCPLCRYDNYNCSVCYIS